MRYIKIEELLKKQDRWGRSSELWKNITLKKDFRDFFSQQNVGIRKFPSLDKTFILIIFRPKAAIRPFQEFKYNQQLENEGYYWLKNVPENYRACCIYANRKTGNGGKRKLFPFGK